MTAADALPDDFAGCSRRLAHVDKPVVAVEGWALGGGCELLRMLKDATTHAHHPGLEEGLAYERCLFHLTFGLDDRREGMAAFVEKRPPGYRDR